MRQEILDEAKREAEDIVKGANKQVENTIRTIREKQAEKSETRKARENLQGFVNALAQKKEQDKKTATAIWRRKSAKSAKGSRDSSSAKPDVPAGIRSRRTMPGWSRKSPLSAAGLCRSAKKCA